MIERMLFDPLEKAARRGGVEGAAAVILGFVFAGAALLVLGGVILASGFVAAMLWDNWHPVAAIMWLLIGHGFARRGRG